MRLNVYPIRVRTCPQWVHGMHNDPVDSPEHYQFGQLEAWDIIELAIADIRDPVTAYHVASALKYLLRAARKGRNTDIAKASAHLKRETARHVVRIPPPPEYDPDSVAFRHGDIGKVYAIRGEELDFPRPTAPGEATKLGCEHDPDSVVPAPHLGEACWMGRDVPNSGTAHPMAAEALRMDHAP